jgi:FKBP-type peptidyl-prolyl cis-trans isomerase
MSKSRLVMTVAFVLMAAGCNEAGQNAGSTTASSTTTTKSTESGSSVSATAKVTGGAEGASGGNVHKLASGLQYEDVVVGSGKMAEPGMNVSVHYTGTFTDGVKFDSSLDRGTPYTFQLGAGEVIQGWDEGIKGMRIGGKRKLTIPPDMAYGSAGRPGIPPNATLLFDVELVGVK